MSFVANKAVDNSCRGRFGPYKPQAEGMKLIDCDSLPQEQCVNSRFIEEKHSFEETLHFRSVSMRQHLPSSNNAERKKS
eukprot:scaffold252328_cov24-Attheya_sp.AAC.1